MSSSTSNIPAIKPCKKLRGHIRQVRGVVHLRGERRIITCSWDSSLRLWDLKSGVQIGKDWRDEFGPVWCMALSPNGKTIASGSGSIDGKVRLWDVKTKKVIARCTEHSNVVDALCWSEDGKRIASGSWDGTARVWDVDSGTNILTIRTEHDWVRAVAYSPDSSKLATGGFKDNAVKIWDAKTGERFNTLKHDYAVRSLAWTSDGKRLISGSYGPIRIFNTATWKQIAILEGHTNYVNAISLSRNNRLLASASGDKTARIWNLDTNLQVGPPIQHEQDLRSATLSPDAKVLVTACADNAYTWDIHSILKKAGLKDLLAIGTNLRTPRSSLDDKTFLDADATQYCPGQFGDVEFSPAFFHGMETNVDSSPTGGAHHHSHLNASLARLSPLFHRFRPDNGESTELPQPSRPSAFHPHALLSRMSSLIHRSPPESDAPDELQQPSTPSRVDSHVLLARLSSFLHRSRLNTDEEAEPHPTTPVSLRPDALVSRLSSLFRSQPDNDEEIELMQHPNRPRVVEVAAVRDRQALVVARGPQFEKAKRAYEQAQSHAQVQASSSHTQPADASTSATPPAPAPGTAAAQPPPIPWWAQIVLFLCCASPPHG